MLRKFYRNLDVNNRSKNTLKSVSLFLNKTQDSIGKPLQDATWDDLLTYIESMKADEYSISSIELNKAKIRQFYAFCFDETEDSRYLKLIKKLKGQIPQKSIRPQDLLNPAEVKRLINVATMEQDRCIVSVLYESGMRAGELIALKVGMVTLDDSKQIVTFNIPDVEGCKTGGRTVVCLEIYPYVVDWLKCHPNPLPDESFIQLKAYAIADRIKKLFERAKINKPCNPHMFRHAAITHAVGLGMQESAIKLRFWGNLDTAMLSTYISLSEQMQSDAYKKAKGMNGDETKVINPLVSRCVKCGKHIQAGELCEQCSENQGLKEELQKQHNLILGILKIDWRKTDAQVHLKELYEAACSTMHDTKEFAKNKR